MMSAKLGSFWKTLLPVDKITVLFCAISALLILSRFEVLGTATTLQYAGNYLLVLAFSLIAVPLIDRSSHILIQNPLLRFVRYLYPALLLGAFFNWTQPVSHMFFSEPFDPFMLKADLFLFGFNPGKELVHILGNNYWLSEFMNFSYLSYYLTPWLVLYFYFAKKKKEFNYSAFVCCLVMFTCFLIQSVLPVEGPLYNDPEIAHHIVAGPISAAAANFLSGADVPGSAMPSGHVAGTLAILFLTWQLFRKAFWYTLPLWVSLCIATVYGHFHYAVDGLAGLALAVIGIFFAGPAIYCRLFPDSVPDAISAKYASDKEESLLDLHTAKSRRSV